MKSYLKFSSKEQNLLQIIYRFAKAQKIKLYLVGGILRDILLGREKENPDIDFCLKKGAINFGRKLAKEIKAGFVVLDKEHGACRAVKKIKDKAYTLDFTDFRGKTLEEDLLHRDFSINAMALELEKVFTRPELDDLLIDPYCGREDLKHKIIKIVSKKAFDEDPLRILRAFSFACLFNFNLHPETLRLIKLKRNKLSQVSFERIRDELFKILDSPCAFDYLLALDKLKILKIIFPEIEMMRNVKQGPYHHLDVWEHTLETIKQLEGLIKERKNNQEIQDYLNEIISSERKRRALIKLGAFLHDIGKPKARRRKNGKTIFHGHERIALEIIENICQRLRLSNDELNALKKIVFCHLRPGYLADNEVISNRAKFRFFRDTANEAISILLMAIADQRSTKGRLTTKESRLRHERLVSGLVKEYFRKKKEKKLVRLINGNDLINKFKLQPSPLIGKILSEIEELQAIGKVKCKTEALKIVTKLIKKYEK
jgi:poly(A) polymerase